MTRFLMKRWMTLLKESSNYERLHLFLINQQFHRKSGSTLECQILHKEILRKHAGIFKDKIGKTDRVNIPSVKLQLDESKDIPTTNVGKRSMCLIIYGGLQGRNLGKWWMPV